MELRTKEDHMIRLAELAEVVGVELFVRIAEVVCIARRQHPDWEKTHAYALQVVKSEMLEWEAQAMLVESPEGIIDAERLAKAETEALHVIGVLISYLSRDYLVDGKEG